jgi:hypothetical protein
MALYLTCQYFIHNAELSHGCYAILIVYHTMPCSSISYALYVVRPGVLSKAIGSLCLWACLSTLLVHPKCGRRGGAKVVSSYTVVVLGYMGSFRYDHAPRCCRGRLQVVTTLSIHYGSFAVVSVVPHVCNGVLKDVTGLDVLRCGTFSPVSQALALSPNHVSYVTLACMIRCF